MHDLILNPRTCLLPDPVINLFFLLTDSLLRRYAFIEEASSQDKEIHPESACGFNAVVKPWTWDRTMDAD